MEPKKILILNLTRMGDIIQSTPFFKKLKIAYPDCRITLVISTEFSELAPFIPYIDEIKKIEIIGLANAINSSNVQFNSEVYRAANAILEGIKEETWDIAINMSHDEFSVYFLYILNSKISIGLSITREGATVSNDKMTSYLFSAVKYRKASILNLVDIDKRCLDGIMKNKIDENSTRGLYLKVPENNEIKDKSNKYRINKGDILVSFAIGASSQYKRWHMDYFADLAKMLLNHDERIKIAILGAPYDIDNGNYIENIVRDGRVLNLAGKTSLSELIDIVGGSSLLVTHDTGTMHIGVSLGVKLIVIYTGHVGFMETGPYAENRTLVIPDIICFPCSFRINCMDPVCKGLIKPEYVFDIAKMELDESAGGAFSDFEKRRSALSKYKNSGIIPYISRFDSNGFIDFLPAVKGTLNLKDLKLRILKLALEQFYEKKPGIADENEIIVFLKCFDRMDYAFMADINEELRTVDAMIMLCERGMSEAKNLAGIAVKSPFELDKINKGTDIIKSIDFELKYMASPFDELALLNQIHTINQNNSVSYDIFGISIDSLKSYSEAKLLLKIFKKTGLFILDKLIEYDDSNKIKFFKSEAADSGNSTLINREAIDEAVY